MTGRRIFPRPLPALAANLEFRNKQRSGGQTKNLSGDAKEKRPYFASKHTGGHMGLDVLLKKAITRVA